MKYAMEKAGIDTSRDELYMAAQKRLTPSRDPYAGADRFAADLRDNPALLRAIAIQYLRLVAADMEGERASRRGIESQMPHDRPLPKVPAEAGGRKRREQSAIQESDDLPAQSSAGDGARRRRSENQKSDDRPVPAGTKISKTAASHVASGIWKQEIGIPGINLAKATRHHFLTIKRKTMALGCVADAFLTEIEWPDDGTPLAKVATEGQVKKIWDRRHEILDQMGLTNV